MTGQIGHAETNDGITYTLSIEKDDQPVRGNASAIDPETDRKAEDFVYMQLRRGNLRAWCVVTVTASIGRDGVRFEGQDHLGACSCRNRQEFMQPGGYWEAMWTEARLSLQAQLPLVIEHDHLHIRQFPQRHVYHGDSSLDNLLSRVDYSLGLLTPDHHLRNFGRVRKMRESCLINNNPRPVWSFLAGATSAAARRPGIALPEQSRYHGILIELACLVSE